MAHRSAHIDASSSFGNFVTCLPSRRLRAGPHRCQIEKHGRRVTVNAASELYEVDAVKGIRVVPGAEADIPDIEYLVGWKDGSKATWEPSINLSPDLIRDFDENWWKACRDNDKETIAELLRGGGDVLAQVCDENGRSALHFAAAVGREDICRLLLACGADPNLPDKDGYTPLHMSSGYLQMPVVKLLLDEGADCDFPDEAGRTPLSLMEGLRDNLPADNPNALARRIALEKVIGTLTDDMYDFLEPVALLDVRNTGEEKEYLVCWPDESEDSWVMESDLSEDVKDDFEKGLEYVVAERIIRRKLKGDERLYLVSWSDGGEDSWEPEEHLASDLVEAYEKEHPAVSTVATDVTGSKKKRKKNKRKQKKEEVAVA